MLTVLHQHFAGSRCACVYNAKMQVGLQVLARQQANNASV